MTKAFIYWSKTGNLKCRRFQDSMMLRILVDLSHGTFDNETRQLVRGPRMIGLIAGLGLLFSYLGAAWTVDTSEGTLFSAGLGGAFAMLGVLTLVGIFLFPRTVGTAFTPMSFATPIAFVIALIRQGFGYSMFILALGIGAWLVTFIVGFVRRDVT